MSTLTKPSTAHARLEMHSHGQRIADSPALIDQRQQVLRRLLQACNTIYQAGEHSAMSQETAREKVICFAEEGRRDVKIPAVAALPPSCRPA